MDGPARQHCSASSQISAGLKGTLALRMRGAYSLIRTSIISFSIVIPLPHCGVDSRQAFATNLEPVGNCLELRPGLDPGARQLLELADYFGLIARRLSVVNDELVDTRVAVALEVVAVAARPVVR